MNTFDKDHVPKEISQSFIGNPSAKVRKTVEDILELLDLQNYSPNNNQQAAARFILRTFLPKSPRYKRIFLEVASGLGKSFIILTATALLLKVGVINSVDIIYSEPEILAFEQPHVNMMKQLVGAAKV